VIKEKLIIIGAGQLGNLVSNIIDKKKYEIFGFIDNDKKKIKKKINQIKVLGDDKYLSSISPKKFGLVLCLGNIKSRIKFLSKVKKNNFRFPKIIDQNFREFNNVKIGKGTIILSSVNILNNSNIGKFCVIGTNANILHDVNIGDNCIIGGGANIGSNVTLKKNIFVGIGAVFASKKIVVNDNSYICSGSVIFNNLSKNSKVIGNPARAIPPKNK
jgi:sugar O-acyltransferase (sialic acid O-acetyltransferase NeuD family)